MEYMDLLLAHERHDELGEIVKAIFDAVGISDGQERESGNYVGGYYFKGSCHGLSLVISCSDEDGNEDLPFWLHISMNTTRVDEFNSTVDRIVKDPLLLAGFHLARIVNFGKRDAQRVDYSRGK